MTLVELKKSIHERVDNLDDPNFLEMLNNLISQKNEVFQIAEEHLTGIEQGIHDTKNGDVLSLEQLEKRYEKWLKD
ncbi:MAG: hypothetical protein ACXVAY_17365 [Mucilaginibacter sp.]